MKKQHFLFPFILAVIAMMAVSCQKEKGTVTLGAEIQRPANADSKVYLEWNTPAWVNGDRVLINDAVYQVFAASGSSAQIENVTARSSYRALYPASLVAEGTDISSSASIPITLPAVQTREYQAGRLKMDIPMGAYLSNGNTLEFHNLCSIVRITISNSLNAGLWLGSIVLHADNACLSGAGTASVTGSSSDCITMASNASHDVTLDFTGNNPYIGALSTSGSWDILVPAFTTDNVTITVNTTDGQYFEISKPNVALTNNTITTVTLNVNDLNVDPTMPAVLGRDLHIPSYATAVRFEYNSSVSSGELLSTGVIPIYGNLVGSTWVISTSASTINAPTDCYRMFLTQSRLRSIDFGSSFNTANVINMESMFDGCSGLTSLDLSMFNTSNVTNMSWMFYGCRSLTSLDLSNFNTSNVTKMGWMFESCNNLTNLDISSFNTSNVTEMNCMFQYCNSLSSIDVSNFITSNATTMAAMFKGCNNLTSIDVSNFNTLNVRDMNCMFADCYNLTTLDLSNFNTSNVILMYYMFDGCSGLTSLNLSHFDMGIVAEKENMCRNLSITSGACTITCPEPVENAIKEQDSDGNYITNLPLPTEVTFTWQRPSSKSK
jgi:surface protein